SCPTATAVLQVPAQALLEGDTVTLRCRVRQNESVPVVRFYHDGNYLLWYYRRTELTLPPLQLHHSGHYGCSVSPSFWPPLWDELAVTVTVTVHGEHLHTSNLST
ncbi:FCGR2 protein, partial [Hippolais icterina]|nr:FCGR2 protein [Hippolais icterina]